MASCLALMGRRKEAQEMVKRLRVLTPVVVPTTAEHWRIREDREYYLEGLRLAVGQTPANVTIRRATTTAAVHESGPGTERKSSSRSPSCRESGEVRT